MEIIGDFPFYRACRSMSLVEAFLGFFSRITMIATWMHF